MAMGPHSRRCRRRGCPCPHEVCDRGWVDTDERGTSTRPCMTCRADLAAAIGETVDRAEFRERLSDWRGDLTPLGG